MTLWGLPLHFTHVPICVCVCVRCSLGVPLPLIRKFVGDQKVPWNSESTVQVGRFRLQWWLAYSSGRRIDHCVLTPVKRIRKTASGLSCCFCSRDFEIAFRLWGQILVHFDHFLDFKLKSGPKTATKNGSLRICLIRIARKLVYSHGLRHGMFGWKKTARKVSKCCGKSLFLLTCFDCGYQFPWAKIQNIVFLMLGARKLDHSHLLPLERQTSSSFCLTCPRRYYWRAIHSSLASWTDFVL